jgi:hypothetical protein
VGYADHSSKALGFPFGSQHPSILHAALNTLKAAKILDPLVDR